MGLPQAPQLGKDCLRQRHPSLLVALADDPNQAIATVNRRDLERCSLADAQATGVHEQ